MNRRHFTANTFTSKKWGYHSYYVSSSGQRGYTYLKEKREEHKKAENGSE